ncbi:L-lactate dehydrogenase [Anaeromicropila herbilytica]|uniref:L-lactate dehydrogenase n=1 Tax=Anaeromicropila herbilytica TaxID=2785025 RepID=A0A7R7IC31_9FIRM|nr:L-lactate dehydrogenase [Anaeromicropila herbilytica]BCN30288.1 L-lactate dehydrogenase 3 [Anaeromicropila herbilytica]
MAIKQTKIAIVGAGNVGASTAYNLMIQGLCNEIVLIDINKKKAHCEALDLQHGVEYLNREVKVYDGEYSDCKDADIIVITAAVPMVQGQTRLDMVESASKIVKSIVPPIMESGFSGHFIIITNPVDVMSYYVYKLSGLPKNQIIGTGTSLDSARLKLRIADIFNVDTKSVQGYTIGEHGDSQIVPWSHVTVGGKSLNDILADNKGRFGELDFEELRKLTIDDGWVIARGKGTTNYGIAATTVGIIKAMVNNENRIIPVSTYLDGEYGEKDVFAGVPVVLNATGVKEIVELHITEDERKLFKNSVSVIRDCIDKISDDTIRK